MTDTLRQNSRAFLTEVEQRVGPSHRSVDFDAILERLNGWSQDVHRKLVLRKPGDQHTVSFRLSGSDIVLWAAYPKMGVGAKVVVLPRIFPRLHKANRDKLLAHLADTAPRVHISGNGLLQLDMPFLTSDQSLDAFLDLLDTALLLARSHSPAAA